MAAFVVVCVLEIHQPGFANVEQQPFCYKCGSECLPGVNFCRSCGMPLSNLAVTGPYESILARGFLYREATDSPRKLIVVLGMLLLWAPWLLFFGGSLIATLMGVL